MYRVILKTGSYSFLPSDKGELFDFEKYLYNFLLKHGLAIDSLTCCHNSKSLKLKPGVVEKNFDNKNKYFNLDKWLLKKLEDYGLTLDVVDCCPTKKSTQLVKEYLYFKSDKNKKPVGLSLDKWLFDYLKKFNLTGATGDCQCT